MKGPHGSGRGYLGPARSVPLPGIPHRRGADATAMEERPLRHRVVRHRRGFALRRAGGGDLRPGGAIGLPRLDGTEEDEARTIDVIRHRAVLKVRTAWAAEL